jgi:hypothetical protein
MTAWEGSRPSTPPKCRTRALDGDRHRPRRHFFQRAVTKLEDCRASPSAPPASPPSRCSCSGRPNAIAQSETYEALSRGVVQANLSPR